MGYSGSTGRSILWSCTRRARQQTVPITMEFGAKIDRVLSKPEIDLWLAQFDAADRWAVERLLQHFRYYDVTAVVHALATLYERIEQGHEAGRPQIYVPCGEVASSASLV